MYKLEVRKTVDNILHKLNKKNPKQLEIIHKKINEIKTNPHRYKNLRKPLNHLKRVHIDKNYVLVYSINEKQKTIIIEDYSHHNQIYQTKK